MDGLSPMSDNITGAAVIAALLVGGLTLPDNKFSLTGSSDATKIGRFELDGNTTGTTRVYTMPDADTTLAGLSVAQSFSALQTFSNGQINIGGNAAGGAFTILNAAAGTARLILARTGGANRIAFGGFDDAEGVNDDGTSFRVRTYNNAGTFIDDAMQITRTAGTAIAFARGLTVAGSASASGTPARDFSITPAAHLALTASTEYISVGINGVTQQFATGACSRQALVVIGAPTYAFVGASTITDAATVAITGAPNAGTNATLTASWALWLRNTGHMRMDGNFLQTGAATFATGTGAITLNGATVVSGSLASDYFVKISNAHATGLGLRVQPGADGNNAFAVRNAAGSTETFTITGGGVTAIAGSVTITGGNKIDADRLVIGDGSTYIGKFTYSGSNLQLGSYSSVGLQLMTNGAVRMSADVDGNIIIGTGSLLTTTTDGFLYVPACAGPPTGTPTTVSGRIPVIVDSTNNKLYFYSGGSWRDAGP